MSFARRVRGPALTAAAGAGALVLLHFRDPHQSGSWGFCPFLEVTGHPCPLCGGLRAMNDLTRGHIGDALTSNAAAVFILIAGAALIVRWFVRRARGEANAVLLTTPKLATAIFAVAMVIFTVYRWTPWGNWLYQA
ncbi:membrane protein [Flexivirga endophytica]|nr:membrane protein [Flexivirga endophytica]